MRILCSELNQLRRIAIINAISNCVIKVALISVIFKKHKNFPC